MKELTISRVKEINTGLSSSSTDVLHHIGLVNNSLEYSATCYEKLGFLLTPVSIPRIILEPGGVPETLGVANRHAIFAHNYLELLGVTDPARWAMIDREKRGPYDLDLALNRFEGLHVMHFGTNHIDAVKDRLDYQGVMCSPVHLFERNVQTENGERMMKARTIGFPPDFNPEGLIQVAQHDTPELVFQQRYMHHQNGAIALTEILIVTDTPAIYTSKYELYTGHTGRVVTNGHYTIDLGFSGISVVDPERLDNIIPGYKIPALPFMAGFNIRVASLGHLCDVLSGNNVPFVKTASSVVVYPEDACGCAVIFEE